MGQVDSKPQTLNKPGNPGSPPTTGASTAQSITTSLSQTLDMSPELPVRPPPYEEVAASPPGKWEMVVLFGSDLDSVQKKGTINLSIGWFADLYIDTHDIVGLMRNGLYLTQDNIRAQEGHIKQYYSYRTNQWFWYRYFAIVGPNWSGCLYVRVGDIGIAHRFRMDDLSADKIYEADVKNKDGNLAYKFCLKHPEMNVNCILDEFPMRGLWPWPRELPDAKDQDAEEKGKE
ncbi:hypothetical protein F66182_9826 [Fusarium sp. NRRL 66182]|nr:hypothetical protein F66182_9826 [Fusarium sp. NRRL 66182]